MDDGMLGGAMTLQELGGQLLEMRQEMLETRQEMRTGFEVLRGDVNTPTAEVATLGVRTATLDSKVTVGFEQTHALLRFGLEAREALRESMDARFDAADRKHDEQIGLLKDVLRDLRRAG